MNRHINIFFRKPMFFFVFVFFSGVDASPNAKILTSSRQWPIITYPLYHHSIALYSEWLLSLGKLVKRNQRPFAHTRNFQQMNYFTILSFLNLLINKTGSYIFPPINMEDKLKPGNKNIAQFSSGIQFAILNFGQFSSMQSCEQASFRGVWMLLSRRHHQTDC